MEDGIQCGQMQKNLAVTTEEKDLGVIFDEKYEFSKHIKVMVNRANRMLGMIRRRFTFLDQDVFELLYPVLVRPHLEYCVQVWSPHKQMDINLNEKVQMRAMRMVRGMKDLSYEERMVKLGLTRLVERRLRGDMIETYKLLTNNEEINRNIFFEMRNERWDPEANRGLVIFKKRTSGRCRSKFTFSQRVVNPWNKLQKKELQAKKTSNFKAKFDANEVKRKSDKRNLCGNRTFFQRLNVVGRMV